MNDREFLTAFEDCTLPEHLFRHRDHIRMAWLILRRDGWQAGRDNIRAGIQKYAAAHGATGLYHDTITCFYAHVVHHAIQSNPTLDDFADFEAQQAQLFDKRLIFEHYSRDIINSAEARQGWVEPDLQALPMFDGIASD